LKENSAVIFVVRLTLSKKTKKISTRYIEKNYNSR
jgi:hypothetical protein